MLRTVAPPRHRTAKNWGKVCTEGVRNAPRRPKAEDSGGLVPFRRGKRGTDER
jgi:hypothetical protein